MIGEFNYDELKKLSESLSSSSKIIREITQKYDDNLENVTSFCSSLDSYTNFLDNSINLYQDSEAALENIVKKCG